MASSMQQQDFLSVVQGFLDRGQVYKPPEEFVKNLALCPSCRGGKEQCKVLEEALLKMVSLVKSKLDEPGKRNKSMFQSWLKNAAKAMELYQVIGRDWICANVWKLPELPVRKEQDYDPSKGRRDIRFFPESDSKLLELTEEESMTVDLDYVDEDTLLSLSPAKVQEDKIPSPRRSPRFQKQKVTPTPSEQRSLPREKTQKQQGEENQSQACSQGKRSPRKQSSKPMRPTQVETCGPTKLHQHRDTPATLSSTSSQESYQRPAMEKAPVDKDRVGACSSIIGERQVRIAGDRKRPGSRYGEDLIISTSTLKRSRTDELVSQVRHRVEERREKEANKRDRHRSQKCWVPGCVGDARYLKAHACYDHIPSIFDERLEPADQRVLSGRRNALKKAGRWLLGRPVELDEVVAFVIVQKMFSTMDNTEITTRQQAAMMEFCKFLHEPVPDKFTLEPCNSTGVLLHWKALLLIVASLGEEERSYWRKTFSAPEDVDTRGSQLASPVRSHPEAFDAHFHLDRTLRDLHLPRKGSLGEILDSVPVDEAKKINLVGSVAVYCDPRTYPTDQCLQQMPQHVSVAVGFHPKHAKNSRAQIEEEVREFRRMVRHPRVVAFGEVGIDHSEPMKYWAYQMELLEKILPFLEDRHVLVIHCRGMKGDCGTEAFLLLLFHLRRYVRSHQSIHLHCFTGNRYVVQRWLEVFPRTFFGFTNLARQFDEEQIAASCGLEENRLLLESDPPYFPVSEESRVSSPGQLMSAAEAVATHRQLSPERVLEITLANSQHHYHGQQ